MALQVLTYGQLDLSSHRRISTQSDADNKYEISALPPLPQPYFRLAPPPPRREIVLLVSVALGETPPRHAGHAVQPSQYAVTVPQYGVASFCTSDSRRRRRVEKSYSL